MNFGIRTIVLEGPDCSGKTTAYGEIHRRSKFKWNIQDRSSLSMLCYALLYGRDPEPWRQRLQEEVNDLNNVIVILMPPPRVIVQRLKARGDEFQTVDSVSRLYEIFDREAEKLKSFPNVFVCRSAEIDYNIIVDAFERYTPKSYDKLGDLIEDHAKSSKNSESINLTFTWSDDRFTSLDQQKLLYEKEINYYTSLREKFIKKISDELNGLNEYMMCQTSSSRRFVIAQDTCISFVQAMIRNDRLYLNAICRSSEVSNTFKHDIHFIADLGKIARTEIGAYVKDVYFHVTISSAHIIK